MTKIGIRELRQNASAYLRLVKGGETVQIAERGRPVALWIAIPEREGVTRLALEGRLTEAEGDVLELGPPLRALGQAPPPSRALLRARKHER
jgi:antitoxin (DNA-binding transcriptional repressor) of toxin-antitoxin stability system